jgi:hypothetical protein
MKIREIHCKRWFLGDKVDGITLYPFIFYRGQPADWLRKHEWVHVMQVRRHGWLKFYVMYLYYQVRFGYEKNPFEIEAYSKASPTEV